MGWREGERNGESGSAGRGWPGPPALSREIIEPAVAPATGHRRDLRLLGTLLALIGFALLALAPQADATPARYVFEMCDSALPGGGVEGVTYYQYPASASYSALDTCSQPTGNLSISESGIVSGEEARWNLPILPPKGGRIESITISANSCGESGTVAFAYFETWPPQDPWPPSDCGLEKVRTFSYVNPAVPLFPFWVWLGCNNASGCNGSIYAHYFATTEMDPVPPTLANLRGSALSGSPLHGHQELAVDAHDEGGGLSKIAVTVNGAPAGVPDLPKCNVANANNPSVKGLVAAAITPCPTAVSPDWSLDTQASPFHEGANSVQICASDFATLGDPNTTCSAPQTVQIDNSCTASPIGGGEVLSAQFTKSKSESLTVANGEPAKVSGRLAGKTGKPIAGATLCVEMRTPGVDALAKTVGTVTTDADGAYAYEVPPGPNREITFGYRHDASQLTQALRYYARAKPSLHRSPAWLANGRPIHLWGQLPGPNSSGRVVVLQANVVGSKRWVTFRRATTGDEGDFHSKYRFRSTSQTTVYRFRALVPAQTDYPWAEGTSAAAKVLVRVGGRP